MKTPRRTKKLRLRRNFPIKASNAPPPSACNNPVGRLRRCRNKLKRLQRGYREQVRATLQEIYVIELELQGNPNAWALFIAEAFWDEHEGQCPTPADHRDPWLFVAMFVHQAHSESKRKLASKHASVLWVLAQENTAARCVSQFIKSQGGIEKLAQRAAARRSQLDGPNKRESTLTKSHLKPAGRSKHSKSETKSLETSNSVEGTFFVAPDLAADLQDLEGQAIRITARVVLMANRLQLEIIRVAPALPKREP